MGAGSTMAGLSYIIYISNPYFFGCYAYSIITHIVDGTKISCIDCFSPRSSLPTY